MRIKAYIQLWCVILLVFINVSCKESTKNTVTNFDTNQTVSSTSESNTEHYTSKMTKADKKKYYNSNGDVVFEIKYKPDGFKLRTASSKLLWKIKLYEQKIKISDNEENLNPYEIKILNTHEAKLEKGNQVLGRTSYNTDKKEQVISTKNEATPVFINKSYSHSLLVMKIPSIPEDQKQIIIDELILKGY